MYKKITKSAVIPFYVVQYYKRLLTAIKHIKCKYQYQLYRKNGK